MRGAIRITAAHVVGARVAVSMGRLDDESPSSVVLTFDSDADDSWSRVSLPTTVVALTSLPNAAGADGSFVALGIDGDVHFLDAGGVERIPGAGTGEDGAAGEGSLTTLRRDARRLYACGTQSRAYERDPAGRWSGICSVDSGLERSSFEGIAARGPDEIVVCGRSDVKYSTTTPEMEAELARLEREGPMQAYIDLMNRLDAVEEYARGVLCFFDGRTWTAAGLTTERHLNDVAFLDSGFVVAVGDNGALFVADGPRDVQDRSSPDLRETLRQVRCTLRVVYVLGDAHVFAYDRTLSQRTAIALPPELGRPVTLDVVDDALWCFGATGIAQHHAGTWRVLEIPERL